MAASPSSFDPGTAIFRQRPAAKSPRSDHFQDRLWFRARRPRDFKARRLLSVEAANQGRTYSVLTHPGATQASCETADQPWRPKKRSAAGAWTTTGLWGCWRS